MNIVEYKFYVYLYELMGKVLSLCIGKQSYVKVHEQNDAHPGQMSEKDMIEAVAFELDYCDGENPDSVFDPRAEV
jgi:hypothetical protein